MGIRSAAWGDAELGVLLRLLREHTHCYVYMPDGAFTGLVRQHLPDKGDASITDIVRELMKGFAFAMNTSGFRKEVLRIDQEEIYVYEHLYETTVRLPENRRGGVWHPDDLCRLLNKIRQYRDMLGKNRDLFFTRIQIWGKSVDQTRSKFFALREVYIDERRKTTDIPSDVIAKARLEALAEAFMNVPPPPKQDPPTVAAKGVGNVWTNDDIAMLIDGFVRMTEAAMVDPAAGDTVMLELVATLQRSVGSILTKLNDLHERFRQRFQTNRATALPEVLFDPTSLAFKVFSSDWSDKVDPYAAGYHVLRRCRNQLKNASNRAKKQHEPLSIKTRLRDISNNEMRSPSARNHMKSVDQLPSASTTKTPMQEFIEDCSRISTWEEDVVIDLCVEMAKCVELYQANKVKDFYRQVAANLPSLPFNELFFNGTKFLKRFEQRFETLDHLGDHVQAIRPQAFSGADVVTVDNSVADPANTLEDSSSSAQTSNTPTQTAATNDLADHREVDAWSDQRTPTNCIDEDIVMASDMPSTGKANSKTQSMIHPTTQADDSSPSVLDSSPEHDTSDDVDEAGDDVRRQQDNDEGFDAEESVGDAETQSLGSSEHSSLTADFDEDCTERKCDGLPGKRHLASKTVVVKKSSRICCGCAGHDRRKRTRSTVRVHRKRSVHEVYSGRHSWRTTDSAFDEYSHDLYESDSDSPSERRAWLVRHTPQTNEASLLWVDMMTPTQDRIKELENKRKELLERKEDRERLEGKQLWSTNVRLQVKSLFTDVMNKDNK